MNPRRTIAATFILLVASVSLVRADLSFPSFTNDVVDAANVIPDPDEAALVAKLKSFQERTGHQFAVATVPSLQGTSVEDFGNRLFRDWRLGDRERNDGVLLLVAPSERKVRIEVGYGLEGDLTDAVSRLIIENAIVPRFKAGDIPGGIARGADDVMAVFSGQADEYKARAAAAQGSATTIETVVFVLFVCFFLYVLWRALRGGAGRSRGRRGGGPWIIGGPMGGGWSGGSGGGGFSGGGGGSSGGGGASGGW